MLIVQLCAEAYVFKSSVVGPPIFHACFASYLIIMTFTSFFCTLLLYNCCCAYSHLICFLNLAAIGKSLLILMSFFRRFERPGGLSIKPDNAPFLVAGHVRPILSYSSICNHLSGTLLLLLTEF
jgi:hypothetical protein